MAPQLRRLALPVNEQLSRVIADFDCLGGSHDGLADANVRRIEFYESAGFVLNQAKREIERTDTERSVSMRLDLLEGLKGEGRAEQPAHANAEQ